MYVVGFVTCPDRRQAEKLARALLEERLAACVNVVPLAFSLYWWQGKIHKDREVLLLLKTRARLSKQIEKHVRRIHPYTVPEVIFLPIRSGSRSYLQWLAKETRR